MENPSIDYYVLLIGGTAAFLLMAAGILFFVLTYNRKILEKEAVHQQDLFFKNLEATESERKRVARELHDEVGSSLAMMRLLVADSPDANNASLKSLIDKTVDEIRRISNDLLPNGLEEFGLEYALENLFDKVHSVSGLNVEFTIEPLPPLDHKVALSIYRIIQEVLNNTLKYAKANRAMVDIIVLNNQISVAYQDDGIGFDLTTARRKNSLGLNNIVARTEFLDGTVNFTSAPGSGMSVQISIPRHEKN